MMYIHKGRSAYELYQYLPFPPLIAQLFFRHIRIFNLWHQLIMTSFVSTTFLVSWSWSFSVFLFQLYHACDQEGRYSFCVVDNSVLQALDFYCGLLSFWVTLIAMASLPWVWKSLFQLLGAIGIVLAVKMDRQSMWAFVIPTAFAALVLFTSWVSPRSLVFLAFCPW